jgi:tetratricopeptide (TPR) repeat protein
VSPEYLFSVGVAFGLKNGLKVGDSQVAIYRNNLGMSWDSLGEYPKAIEYLDKALRVFNRKLGKDHPNTKIVSDNLQSALQALKANAG